MRKHDLAYFIREGVGNMFSHGFMSFAAVGITVACMLIMGTFTLVAVNADQQLKDMEQSNEILAYVEETYSDAEAKALQKKLEGISNVLSATYISKEEAMANFVSQYPDEEMFQDLDVEIFRDRYSIRLVDIRQMSQTVQSVKKVEGVVKVNAQEQVAGGFVTIRNVATVVCVALIAILAVVSIFIVSNTIKLTTFDRRDEIAIMRMVGATNGFIRWPFVYEGFFMGIISALVAFFCQWLLYEAVVKGVSSNDSLQLLHLLSFENLWQLVAVSFTAAGIVIGVGGSLAAIHKFLQV